MADRVTTMKTGGRIDGRAWCAAVDGRHLITRDGRLRTFMTKESAATAGRKALARLEQIKAERLIAQQ